MSEFTLSIPIPMVLFCPACGEQHIDAPQPEQGWTNPPHRSHECQVCGTVWRPADIATTGVATLSTAGQRDTQDLRELYRAVRLADFLLLPIDADADADPRDEAGETLRELASEADEAIVHYRRLRAGRKARCLCPGCPELVPVEWAAGVCRACGTERCDHDDAAETPSEFRNWGPPAAARRLPLTPAEERDIWEALLAGPVVKRRGVEASEARPYPEPPLPGSDRG